MKVDVWVARKLWQKLVFVVVVEGQNRNASIWVAALATGPHRNYIP